MRINHKGRASNCTIIESFQAERDTVKGGGVIKAGSWWLYCKIMDDRIWKAIKSCELTGFSMAGKCQAEEAD